MLKVRVRWVLELSLIMAITALWSIGHAQPRKPDVEYVPTPHNVVAEMLRLAGVKKTDVLYDLGCGDGRVVIAAVKEYGARGVGVDIDPERIEESRANAKQAGVADRVTFLEQDLFKSDIREATVVTLYLLPQLNRELRPKLFSDLKPGTRVVSHDFDMGDWHPDKVIYVQGTTYEHTVFYWVIPADVRGVWRLNVPTPTGARQYRLHLQQQYQEVHGSLSAEGEHIPLTNVTLTGDHLRFTVTMGDQKMSFVGRATGPTMRGSVDMQGGALAGRHDWTSQRAGANTSPTPPR